MATTTLSGKETLKDLPLKLQRGSLKERQELFGKLRELIQDDSVDLSEGAVKAITKILPLTLPRYLDNKSRTLIRDFLELMSGKFQVVVFKSLIGSLTETFAGYEKMHPTPGNARTALAGLSWTIQVTKEDLVKEGEGHQVFMKCLELQSVLTTCIMGAQNVKLIKACNSKLDKFWKSFKTDVILNSIMKMESSMHSLVYGSLFIHWQGEEASSKELKKKLIESLVKNIITVKTKSPLYILQNLKPLLKKVDHEEFKTLLLPPIQKGMLRNPEIVLEGIAFILISLNLDLSAYVNDLAKSFGTNLHAKEDANRDDAVTAISALASQCSDVSAIEKLLSTIFGVLNGSEGKISVNSQKMSLLQAAGNVSKNAVSSSSLQKLCVQATELFIKVLDTEVHEGTLVQTLEMMALWTSKYINEIPKVFVDYFPKGITLKVTSSPVRIGYLTCLVTALTSNTMNSAIPLIPSLMKIIETSTKQSNQISAVSEAAIASLCIIKMNAAIMDQTKLNEFWKIVNDPSLFINDRFLQPLTGNVLISVVSLAEKVILEHQEKSGDQWFKVIVVGLLSNDSRARRHSQMSVKKMVSALGGEVIGHNIIRDLTQFILDNNVLATESAKDAKEGGDLGASGAGGGGSSSVGTSHVSNWTVSAGSVIQALTVIASTKLKSTSLLVSMIIPCHFPIIWKSFMNIWGRLCSIACETTAKDVISKEIDAIMKVIRESLIDKQKHSSISITVQNLIALNPDALLPPLMIDIRSCLNLEDIKISAKDFAIYESPEGEVYDKSVIENIKDDNGSVKNIKRENKAYSYKEQMEELALRKEIEEKKRKEGKLTEPKLTPKQKEALGEQLEIESEIRQKVKILVEKTRPFEILMPAAVEGCPEAFTGLVTELLPLIFACLESPLAANCASDVLFKLRKSVFDSDFEDSLAQSIVAITIQIIKPAYSMSFSWNNTQLRSILASTLNALHLQTVPPKKIPLGEEDESCPMSTPAFSFCFHVINKALYMHKEESEEILVKGFEIISEHASLRGVEDDNDTNNSITQPDSFHPKFLPRARMLRLLIDLLSLTEGRTQQTAVSALNDVACSASGKLGCARANNEEIQILLNSLTNDVDAVRDAALRGLKSMVTAFPHSNQKELYTFLIRRVYVAKFDRLKENAESAKELWNMAELETYPELSIEILSDVTHPISCVRTASADALSELLQASPKSTQLVLDQLLEIYDEKLEVTPAVLDSLGRVVDQSIDHWEPRVGIALALSKMSSLFSFAMVKQVASFLVPGGLGDRNETVRKHMLDAAVITIDLHGKDTSSELLPVFEDFLDKAPSSGSYDNVRQSVVILMGSLARHLDPTDPKVRPIMRQLIIALNTPSQQVQEAVANCLPPLVPTIKEESPSIVANLIETLLGSDIGYGERKGAAYGIAGIVKGLGILSLKQLDIMSKLQEAIQNKKNPKHREGALFAFEMLCNMLGRLFEPYIVHILPNLLLCFGDPVDHVREAADDTAKAVMTKLSAHGVKLVLPALLNALEQDQWRTKTGSVELLGAMAFCAPKQLSSCLPSIVPKLIEVLGDSHHKVQNAGAQALKQIGSVIRNPEIQAIVPVLLKALQDPSKKTGVCLQTLLDTKFVHFIDAPSLALIMPVVQRAFQDRSTETRKMAAQIIGNMYSLTDQKDLSPYLPGIIPGLKTSLLDPVPEVRAVSARALGAMVKGMGESSFEELLPWLMSTLTSESSSVDRSGAAQGLAEVVGGLGAEKMNALMPDIIKTAERHDIAPHVKDGYIMMFIYMPLVFPEEFRQYLTLIISPILRALADENEFVRETAYKAGQRLVITYADTAIELLLPELEKGLFEENWRIRYSSVQLLGDLLYKISGVSGKMSTETAGDDDNFGTEASQKVIINILGGERRNRVLAGLYMGRSDVALMVRQASLHVWKVIVSNTPKTLREILPTLFNLLLGCLASNSYDKRQVAARTLGDLVKKLGERVLPEIIPILEQGLESEQPEKRQGVCVGLSEIMASTSRDMVLTFVDSLVPTVKRALCDDLPEVREAAAKTFDSLHNTVGSRALDDILPSLLEQLDDPIKHEATLDGLRQVMAIKSRAVLPYLIPKLITKPVNSKALANLAPVAGPSLHRHLAKILPALLTTLSEAQGTPREQDELNYAQSVVLSIQCDEDEESTGVSYIMEELMTACKSKESSNRRSAVTLLNCFCSQSKTDYSQYVPQLIRSLILLFTDSDQVVLTEAWNALNAVIKTLDTSEMTAYVGDIRTSVRFAMMDLKDSSDVLPGFCLPKGIAPVLPIFRESILNAPPEVKEHAANGLKEIIKVTSPEALKPSVVHITGPLIRILGDRFSASVKTSVLDTLACLLEKAGVMLKPFFPQLQTTFLKALNDANRNVRIKSGIALGFLITIHMRPDPLFNELITGIKNAGDDHSIRDTYFQALRGCCTPSGDKMNATTRKQIMTLLLSYIVSPEDTSRSAASGCLGAFCKWLPEDELDALMNDNILNSASSEDWVVRHGRSTVLFVAIKEASERMVKYDKLESLIINHLGADRVPIAMNGARSIGYLFMHHLANKMDLPSNLITPFCKSMNHSSNEVKRLIAVLSTHLAKRHSELPSEFLKPLLPMLVNGTKEKNSAVKYSSECALVAVLRLRDNERDSNDIIHILDAGGARDALQDVINKVLQKIANQPEGIEEVIDDTILL